MTLPRLRLRSDVFLTLALVGSLGVNVWAILHIKAPRADERTAAVSPRVTEVGTLLAPFEARNVALGRDETIRFDAAPLGTVLYVLSPSCGWCTRNAPAIRALAAAAGAQGYRFVGLALRSDGLAEYLRDSPVGFPVYDGIPQQVVDEAALGGTPQTLVVSTGGQVLQSWLGAYEGVNRGEVESYFHVRLP